MNNLLLHFIIYSLLTFSNGDIYSGSWLNDLKDGNGEFTENRGKLKLVYFGQWLKNKRIGKGVWKIIKLEQEHISDDNAEC